MNRSEKIRQYLRSIKCNLNVKSNPDSKGSPSQVVKALKKKGVVVTVHHVGMVKLKLRKKSICIRNKKKKDCAIEKLSFAKRLLNSCDNNLSLAKINLEVVSKLLN